MASSFVRNSFQELRNFDYTSSSSKSQSISSSRTTMQFPHNFRTLCSRFQTMLRQRLRKQKRSLQISPPFNLQREPVNLPGISEDEITMLREKAAASRIGVADHTMPRKSHSPTQSSSLFSHPVRPPVITVHPPHATTSTESL